IYEFFEEPRLFSVENEVGSTYLVYWIGDDEHFDNWFIIPISRLKLSHLENKKIDIRSVLINQEQKSFYKARIPFDPNVDFHFYSQSAELINSIVLPIDGLFISDVIAASRSTARIDANELSVATHEIHIEKSCSKSNKSKGLLLDHVTRVCESFNDFYDSLLSTFDISGGIKPLAARPGSFILAFSAEELPSLEVTLSNLNQLILHKRDIKPFLKQHDIDIKSFSALLSSIVDTSTCMELKSNLNDEVIINIRKSDAVFYLKDMSRLALQYVSSYQVPQANDLEKLFRLVSMTWNGDEITSKTLGVDERHVLYYRHAAKVMGFFESNGAITALGQQLAEANEERKFRIAARSFESSYCGWAWINWSGVEDLAGLNPNTASMFLLQNCASLSTSTAKRRSSTLSTWCEMLQPYYNEW
ncbi:DUF6575 domain-containing protein, partial [Yersinia enterocolitica]